MTENDLLPQEDPGTWRVELSWPKTPDGNDLALNVQASTQREALMVAQDTIPGAVCHWAGRIGAPFVGMGASWYGYSDSKACSVVAVGKPGKDGVVSRVTLREDKATLLNGVNSGEPDALQFAAGGFVGHTSGAQRWQIRPNPDGRVFEASLRKDRTWRESGTGPNGPKVRLGQRSHHYDFNF